MGKKNQSVILFSIIIILILSLVTANLLGNKQDEAFQVNSDEYTVLLEAYSSNDFETAVLVGTQLLSKVPDSEIVNYMTGISSVATNEFEKAAILLQRSLDLNPHRVEDPIFMIYFAETLYNIGRFAEAKVVLLKCQQWGWIPEDYPEYQDRVYELLEVLNSYGG